MLRPPCRYAIDLLVCGLLLFAAVPLAAAQEARLLPSRGALGLPQAGVEARPPALGQAEFRARGTSPSSPVFSTLQVSLATLQALDVVSTLRAIDRGPREANPLMRGLVGRPWAFTAVKAGAAATATLLARRVARTNGTAAIIMMAAMNSAYAVIVARNFQAGRPR